MQLAIIGSRNMNDMALFLKVIGDFVMKYGMPKQVISGGCKGADTIGALWAKSNGIKLTKLKPDWNRYGKHAIIMSNQDIIRACTHVLAFPSKYGSGTQHALRLAGEKDRVIEINFID